MNKPVYLGMSILYMSKTLMYWFWYYYVKLKYQDKAKFWSGSFIIYTNNEDFYKDVTDDVEKWFETSSYDDVDRPLPIGKNKKKVWFFQRSVRRKDYERICWA